MATQAKKPAQPIPITVAKGDAAKGNPAAATAPKPPAKKSRGKLLGIVIALAIAAGAGGAGWFHFKQKNVNPAKAAKGEPKKQSTFLPIDQFTVNVPGAGGDHFLQIAFTLEVVDAKIVDEIKLQMPVVRGRLLMLLSSKSVEDLSSIAGKQKLMGEILAETRAPLASGPTPSKGIENVHFSAFVIQ